MTPQEYCYCELRFSMIDRKLLAESYTSKIFHDKRSFQMKMYVEWLLNRWVLLRNNIDHYPKLFHHKSLQQIIDNV